MTGLMRILAWIGLLFLTGCAARQLPGHQNVFYSYTIPQAQLDEITRQFRRNNLTGASVTTDLVGRVRLIGTYQDEDEVDIAFVIAQTVVGREATSPFYPENVLRTRWADEMSRALAEAARPRPPRPPRKLGLVIGISAFQQAGRLDELQGVEDAEIAERRLSDFGYQVTSLKGPAATRAAIEAALRKLATDAGRNDQVFIFISSHGAPPVPLSPGAAKEVGEYKMAIVAYDTVVPKGATINHRDLEIADEQRRNAIVEANIALLRSSVPDSLLKIVLAKPTAGTRMLLDVCYGGNILSDTPDPYAENRARNGQPTETASMQVATLINAPSAASTSKNLFQGADGQPMRPGGDGPSIVATDAPPRTVITAADENQESYGPNVGKNIKHFHHPMKPGTSFSGSYFTQLFFDYIAQEQGSLTSAFGKARTATLRLHELLRRMEDEPQKIVQDPQLRTNEPAGINLKN